MTTPTGDLRVSFVGMTEEAAREAAQKAGQDLRVSSRDGEFYLLTCDWRPDRRNITLKDGVVIVEDFGLWLP